MDRTITYNGGSLFYRLEGPGSSAPSWSPSTRGPASAAPATPLVLLHGFAEDNFVWERQIAPLAKGYRLIIPDLPGSGHSSPLANLPSMEELATAVKAILDAESVKECILIGHSMGGYVTLAFAEKYPGRLKGFGLFHSTAYGDSEEKKAARLKSIEFIRKNGSAPFIRQSVPNLFSETFRKEYPEIVSRLIDRYSSFHPESLIMYYEAMIQRPDRTSVLHNFSGPVLFIIGGQDNAVPLEHSLQQCHLPAISHIHLLPRAAHMGMWEDSGHGNHFVHSFLNYLFRS